MARRKKKETVDLEFKPHKYQIEFFTGWRRYNELICTRRWGKTVAACMKLTDSALKMANRRKQPKFAYVAPQKDQAKQITWPIFKEFLYPLIRKRFAKINDQSMEVHFLNSYGKPWAQIKLYGADNGGAETIRGNYLDGAVVDEADQIDCAIVLDEIIFPTLEDTLGWLLLTGTIRGRSNLYNIRMENFRDPEWNIKIYPFESCWKELPAYCDLVDGVYVPSQYKFENVKKRYRAKPNAYAREYQCDWNADGIDSLIPSEVLIPAMGKHISEDQFSFAPRILGVDVAGEGPDSHTICFRQGNYVDSIVEITRATEMQLADIVARHIDRREADMCFIDHTGGYGAGTLSRLKQLGYRCVSGVNFGNKSFSPNFANKRTEMFHEIRDWLVDGGTLPKDKLLEQELSVLSCVETSAGKAMLVKKDDIRDMIGRSPDRADALALTFASPVRKRDELGKGATHKTMSTTGYNPLQRRKSYGIFR